MADIAAAAIAWIGAEIGGTVGASMIMYSTEIAAVATTVASVYTLRSQQLRQQQAARDAYNASLRDRYVMARGTAEPRQLVLGRQRVSGPIAFVQSYGTNRQNLAMVVLLAAHEIDAVEAIYINDERAILDGSGNVTGVQRRDQYAMTGATGSFDLSSDPASGTVTASVAYGTTTVALTVGSVSGRTVTVSGGTVGQMGTVTIAYQPTPSPFAATTSGQDLQSSITLNGSGNGSVSLPYVPLAGSVRVVCPGLNPANGDVDLDLTSSATVSGSTVSVSGGPAGAVATVTYRGAASNSRLRIRSHLGAPGQAADAGLISALPALWTSAHKLTGQAYLVVEADFDSDAFSGGLPNISALVRGAKVYDPRTGTTAWSENPALLMRHAATSPLCGRLSASLINDSSISAAANVCDTSASYVVNGQTFVRPLYTAGTVYKSGSRPKDLIDDLCLAMAGRWCFVDGQMRVRAGTYVTPLQTLTEAWLTGAGVQVQARPARQDVFNVTTGKFIDERNDYQQVDYPRVAASSYITEDGAELPLELNFSCVTFSGQAQQVAAAMMRDARQGLRLTLTCNMRAFAVEPFDVLNVTLSRFGWVNKPFEVMDVAWTVDGGIQLQLKETDSSTWALGTSFAEADPAPNTRLPNPWYVPDVTGLSCASGTSELQQMADGTISSTIKVTWTAVTDQYVVDSGGGVEVRYGLATTPESQWRTVDAPQATGQVRLWDVQDGRIYLIKARAYTATARGAWCAPVLHLVAGKTAPPANVSGLAATAQPGGVLITVTPSTEIDVATGGNLEIRVGSSWAAGTRIFLGAGDRYTWPWPSAGSYTIRAKWIDSSGNESASDASVSITVGTNALVPWSGITGSGKPADNATVNRVSYGASAPSSPVDGDVWVDISSTPYVLKLRVAGVWAVGSNLSTGALANLNTVGFAQIDDGSATRVSESYSAGPLSRTTSGNYKTVSATNPDAVARYVILHVRFKYSVTAGGGGANITIGYGDGSSPVGIEIISLAAGASMAGEHTVSGLFAVGAGATGSYSLWLQITSGSVSASSVSDVTMRTELILK